MSELSDLEITEACARAIGMAEIYCSAPNPVSQSESIYWPLTNDAQCFALVKRFKLCLGRVAARPRTWGVYTEDGDGFAESKDPNRAICLCVARMKGATKGAEGGK